MGFNSAEIFQNLDAPGADSGVSDEGLDQTGQASAESLETQVDPHTGLTYVSTNFDKLDYHIKLLVQANHPRVMNLELPIPEDYPWEEFLKRHFSVPPFTLIREDYEVIVVGKSKILRLKDTRKPTTFYSLFRFLEFFRSNLEALQQNLEKIEKKHERLRETTSYRSSIRSLLTNTSWDYNSINNKHEIIQKNLQQNNFLVAIQKKLENMLAQNHNVESKWQYLIEPFYQMVIRHINNNFNDGSFNLRMFYAVKTMQEKLAPHYQEAMQLVLELEDAVQQTTAFLKQKS